MEALKEEVKRINALCIEAQRINSLIIKTHKSALRQISFMTMDEDIQDIIKDYSDKLKSLKEKRNDLLAKINSK